MDKVYKKSRSRMDNKYGIKVSDFKEDFLFLMVVFIG